MIDTAGTGLEIGPSFAPICPKSAGYKVEIIDHLNQQDLREKYTAHGVDIDAIEPVDYVWRGETYRELTGKEKAYSWVIASHVIEHTPDLIGFLNGCDDVLADGGTLSLAIPDKRYCFDHLRPKSSLAAIIDAHEQRRSNHSVGTAAECFLGVCALKGAGWNSATAGNLALIHTGELALTAIETVRDGGFLDIHAWTFTPTSFRLIIEDLFNLGFIKLRETGFFETQGNEFFITMGRHGSGPGRDRLDLAVASRDEDRYAAMTTVSSWRRLLDWSLRRNG